MTDSAKSDLQEDLVSLYLRLNGFFTSGFVVHAPWGRGNVSEIDVLAVRFPLHREPEREFEPVGDPFLKLSHNHIEFAICEVKGGDAPIQINRALRKSQNGIARVLRWLGMFDDAEIDALLPKVQSAIQPKEKQTPNEIVTIEAKQGVRIRFYIFAIDRNRPSDKQAFFVGGPSISSFIWNCLSIHRCEDCERRYGASQWGRIAPLVDFFKKWKGDKPPTIPDLYNDHLLTEFYVEVGPFMKRRTELARPS